MSPPTGALTAEAIARHLRACDAHFLPPLSTRVDIDAYAAKLAARALCFDAWDGEALAGLVAAYDSRNHNHTDPGAPATAFITNVSVLPGQHGQGTARRLMQQCLATLSARGCALVTLEVDARNEVAQRLYRRFGFVAAGGHDGAPGPARGGATVHLQLDLTKA